MIWRFREKRLGFEKIRLMGILNVTPDSFSDGGTFFSPDAAVQRALELEKEGADLLDIGGESSRPGAPPVSEEEEQDRVLPIIKRLRPQIRIPISVDTTKPGVARAALEAGADIINDVDGLRASGEMAHLARNYGAGLILTHRRGTPETMQSLAHYRDVVAEVIQELGESFEKVRDAGVDSEQVVLDPGFGFSKTTEQNLELIARLEEFQVWGRPVLVGPSRISFIGALTGKGPSEWDGGTAAAVALVVTRGVQIVRVHNVALMRDVLGVAEALRAREAFHVRP